MKPLFLAMLVCAVIYVASLTFLLVVASKTIKEHGLKTVVEEIWCGKSGCK